MALRAGTSYRQHIFSFIRFGLEELKFLRSYSDVKILIQKMTYLLPRSIGTFDRFKIIPPSLQIEPTNYCNIQCICCSASRTTRQRGFMDFDLFKSIIDDAKCAGVQRVHLYLHGEPMLHPKIVEMIRYIKSNSLGINLTTNGMCFNKNVIMAILHTGVNSADHFTFSMLGASQDIYEGIMKRADFQKVVDNIHHLREMRKDLGTNGPIIETMFYRMPENEHQEEQYLRYWRGKTDHVRLGGQISESFSGYKSGNSLPTQRTQTCSNIWERMTVFWNGDVTLCSQDIDGDWFFGSLMEQSIREIWNSEKLLAIKNIHLEKQFDKFPFCQACDM